MTVYINDELFYVFFDLIVFGLIEILFIISDQIS
ncbi:hypothetical protein GNP82_19560 [Aliivibrio fischeri]|uniref:Uncharacterized protein n=1 Tax=Aliivibrio fischeri TaxID=668 RepID=A0A6N3YYI7_ALIFS|nr:hypothetical protein [Aliivibrio fischeri]MUK39733.1 hypothetical protein [Aliivibrio fischeri]MUK43594.1 hypothetical protein [Aliivibrio fischeri]MUK45706.1 hypothetical protein [Aliivibrio fischeri]MUK81555.1 hypothetical protein [Aliivibrio fischeri]